MATAEQRREREESLPRQGPSAEQKDRALIVSHYVKLQESIDERYPEVELTDEDETRMRTWTPGDPTSDYFGDRESQIRVIAYEREVAAMIAASQADAAWRTAAFRANLSTKVIFVDQELPPSQLDTMPPGELPYFGE